MAHETVLDTLRSVRKADDAIDRLKAESLEARFGRIAEAMQNPEWAGGPAELIATYPKHAVASRGGMLMRVRVTESDDGIFTFDKMEVLQLPAPTGKIGEEVMETAKAAVDLIFENKFDEAAPMVRAIANALFTSGDLRREIMTEVAKRSVSRSAWWHPVVKEHLENIGQPCEEADYSIPADTTGEDLVKAVDNLRESLQATAKHAAAAIVRLSEMKDIPSTVSSAASDIAADLKYAIQALSGADRQCDEELAGVYAGVSSVANQLRFGARFLESLTDKEEGAS